MNNTVNENKKSDRLRGFLPGLLIGVAVTALVCFLGGVAAICIYNTGGYYAFSHTFNKATASDSGELDLTVIDAKLNMIQSYVNDLYYFDEDMTKVEEGIYKGLMYGLDDPYSAYYTEDELKAMLEETDGEYSGIGAMVQKDYETGIVSVIKVFKGSPAEKAGMKVKDILYKVGDVDVEGEDLDTLVRTYIRGEEGSTVDITVLRGDDRKRVELHITRGQVEVETVEYKLLDNKIGYISISEFDNPTYAQFTAAVEDLREKGMKGLVIDLRDNTGGLFDVAVDMLDFMLPDGLMVYTEYKNGSRTEYYSRDGHQVDVPLVLLVNGSSASSSEVFASAIRDFKWGTIIGTQTFGKGIVQDIIPLHDGSGIKLTVAQYYTRSGYDLNGKGLTPDIELELDEGAVYGTESDNQLNAAIEKLLK